MINKTAETEKPEVTEFDKKGHWESIYSQKRSSEVSWYQQHPEYSLSLIESSGVDKSVQIIDIGGGASTLVDCLLATGFRNISVLDIADSAISQAKTRLAQQAEKIKWIVQDITSFKTDQLYELWHDRAVFHFLTNADDRSSYLKTISRALKPGAHVIIATFNLNGPEKCSGLDVVRYSPETLSQTFGDGFLLHETKTEKHQTPSGAWQSFVYCHFIKV